MNNCHVYQVTCQVILLIERLKQNEMLRWISFVEGALVAPPLEVPLEWRP